MVDVTVIIAAWNAERTIRAAVESALAQAGVAIEVVVVDDASDDGTAALVRSIDDPRLAVHRLECNAGPAAARNVAIDAARGRWIAVLDADDTILPGRLSGLAAQASRKGLDIVTDNMWVRDTAGRQALFVAEALDGSVEELSACSYIRRNRMFARRRGDGYLKPMLDAAMLRRHGLRYDTRTRIGEDFLLVAEAMMRGARYGRVRSAGYVYTTGGASISRRLGQADVGAMIEGDRRLMDRCGDRMGAPERAAWEAHLSSLLDAAAFIGMVDSIKARDFGLVLRHAWLRPASVRHFAMPVRALIGRTLGGHAGHERAA